LRARRWLPGREIILVGDSSFAALDADSGNRERSIRVLPRFWCSGMRELGSGCSP
jgi:hypothetical protein